MTFLQSLFTPSESEDVTQLRNEYGGCKLYITFLVQAREFVIFLLNFKTKLVYFLNVLIQVSILIEQVVQAFINPHFQCSLLLTE